MKKAILIVSFGTTHEGALNKSIKALEYDFKAAFPDYDVYSTFTSKMILRSLKSKGIEIDHMSSALNKLADCNYDEVIVQPTHLIASETYNKLCRNAEIYKECFTIFKIGAPLLTSTKDLIRVCTFYNQKFCSDNAALVMMGHGSENYANKVYSKINDICAELGFERIFTGTVNASPGINDIIPMLKNKGIKNVKLTPLMFLAGEHAHNDMAGDDNESWKSRLLAADIKAEPIMTGMGEYPEIRRLYVEHTRCLLHRTTAKKNDIVNIG